MTTYVPGVCNIGPAERRRRRQTGWLGLAATVAALAAVVVLRVPDPWRLLVALPAAGGAVGFLQSALHFCVDFGIRGLYNLGSSLGKEESVMEKDMRRADQRKALQIIGFSGLIGLGVAIIAILLP